VTWRGTTKSDSELQNNTIIFLFRTCLSSFIICLSSVYHLSIWKDDKHDDKQMINDDKHTLDLMSVPLIKYCKLLYIYWTHYQTSYYIAEL